MFRVATYNVHKCKGMDWRVSSARIADVIAHLQADIVATQEVLYSQAEDISHAHRRSVSFRKRPGNMRGSPTAMLFSQDFLLSPPKITISPYTGASSGNVCAPLCFCLVGHGPFLCAAPGNFARRTPQTSPAACFFRHPGFRPSSRRTASLRATLTNGRAAWPLNC